MAAFSRGSSSVLLRTTSLPRVFSSKALQRLQIRSFTSSQTCQRMGREYIDTRFERIKATKESKHKKRQPTSPSPNSREWVDSTRQEFHHTPTPIIQEQLFENIPDIELSSEPLRTTENSRPRAYPWQRTLDNGIDVEVPPTPQQVARSVSANQEVDIYKEPGDAWALTTVTVGTSAFWSFVGLNVVDHWVAIQDYGLQNSVWQTGIYVVAFTTAAGLVFWSYVTRTGLVRKISLVPTTRRGTKVLYARIQTRSFVPFRISETLVPVNQLHVDKSWDECTTPRYEDSQAANRAGGFMKPFTNLGATVRTISYQFITKFFRTTMIKMWEGPVPPSPFNFWSRYMIDGIALEPQIKGVQPAANNSDGKLNPGS
jgi:hypothetical protein